MLARRDFGRVLLRARLGLIRLGELQERSKSEPMRYFFSAGVVGGGGAVVTVGVTVTGAAAAAGAVAGAVVVDGGVVAGAVVADGGVVIATGASCQWPCSTDHTFPGGTSPGG